MAAGIPYVEPLAELERALAAMVNSGGGAFIVQHDVDMVRLARGEFSRLGADVAARFKNYFRPEATDDDFQNWLRRHAFAFFDVIAWMDFLRRFDFVVGTSHPWHRFSYSGWRAGRGVLLMIVEP